MAKIRTKDRKFNKAFASRYGAFSPLAKQLAIACGVSYQAAYYWLNGNNSISLSRFLQFCNSAKLNPSQEISALYKQWRAINKETGTEA